MIDSTFAFRLDSGEGPPSGRKGAGSPEKGTSYTGAGQSRFVTDFHGLQNPNSSQGRLISFSLSFFQHNCLSLGIRGRYSS